MWTECQQDKADAAERRGASRCVMLRHHEAIMSTVASLLVPGIGSAKKALVAMNNLRHEMHECEDLSGRLLFRLLDAFKQLRAMEKEKQATSQRSLDQYGRLLGKCVVFMKKYGVKPLYVRVLEQQKTLDEIQLLHEELDCVTEGLSISRASWKAKWEDEVAAHSAMLRMVIDDDECVKFEMGDGQQQVEAMAELKFGIEWCRGRHTTHERDMIEKLHSQIRRLSMIEEPEVPNWFIPLSEVAYETKPFAHVSTGSLHAGMWNSRGVVVMVQKPNVGTNTGIRNRAKLVDRVNASMKMSHPHVTRIAGANHVASHPFVVLETTAKETFTMRYHSVGREDDLTKWRCLCQAARGLQYLHDEGIIHGGLTLDSILVGGDGVARIVSSVISRPVTEAGSLRYRAPECLDRRPTAASDVYSLGMCVLEAFTGEPPFGCVDDGMVYFLLRDGKQPSRPETLPDHIWSLIKNMTMTDPLQRCSLASVVSALENLGQAKADSRHDLAAIVVKNSIETAVRRVVASTEWLDEDGATDGSEIDTSYSEDEYESYKTGTDDQSDSPRTSESEVSHESDADDPDESLDDVFAGLADVFNLLPDNVTPKKLSQRVAIASTSDKEDATRAPAGVTLSIGPDPIDCQASSCDVVDSVVISQRLEALEAHDQEAAQKAARALRYWASHPRNYEPFVEANAISALVRILQDETHDIGGIVADTMVLLAENPANDDAFTDAIDVLVGMTAASTHSFIPRAISVLSALATRDQNRVRIAQVGGVSTMIAAARGQGCGGQEQARAATVLGRLGAIGWILQAIVDAGGLAPLILLRLRGTTAQRTEAQVALTSLVRGGVNDSKACYRILVSMLRDGNEAQKDLAIEAIAELAQHSTCYADMLKAQVVRPLVQLVQGDPGYRRQRAVRVLASLTSETTSHSTFVAQGGVQALLSLVIGGVNTERQIATRGIRNLSSNRRCHKLIFSSSGIQVLLGALDTTEIELIREAAQAVLNLCPNYSESIEETGAIPRIASLLGCEDDAIKTAACGILSSIASHDDKRMEIVEAGGLAPLIEIIRTGSGEMEASAAAALISLMKDPEVRRAGREMGVMDTLQELATSGSSAQAETHRAVMKALRCEIMYPQDGEYCISYLC